MTGPDPSQDPDILHAAGDVTVDEVRIVSHTGADIDITDLTVQISIFEDMTKESITGEILLADAMNLTQHLPIFGRETLFIDFRTPSRPRVRLKMAVFKITERLSDINDIAQGYRLGFCSPERIRNAKFKVSRAFEGTASEIATQIYSKYLVDPDDPRTLLYAKSVGQQKFVCPLWRPIRAINWLAQRAQADDNRLDASFMFYESLDGYRFIPYGKIVNAPVAQSYVHYPKNYRDRKTGQPDLEKDFRNVESYTVLQMHDQLGNLGSGAFSGNLRVLDPIRKTYRINVYDYQEQFPNVPHVDEYPLLPSQKDDIGNAYQSSAGFCITQQDRFDQQTDYDRFDQWVLQNHAVSQQFSRGVTIKIIAPGDSHRRVGDVVEFEVPSKDASTEDPDWKDDHLNGRYLVTSIRHDILKSTGDYKMYMTLRKDSLAQPIPDEKDEIDLRTSSGNA